LISFSILSYLFSGSWLPSTDTKNLWFYSGLFMVLFSIFFIEPYYTSPKNVIANVTPLLLVFLSIRHSFANQSIWLISVSVLLVFLVASIITIALSDENQSEDHWRNKYSSLIKKTLVLLGTGRVLYSAVFLYFILTYHSEENTYSLVL